MEIAGEATCKTCGGEAYLDDRFKEPVCRGCRKLQRNCPPGCKAKVRMAPITSIPRGDPMQTRLEF